MLCSSGLTGKASLGSEMSRDVSSWREWSAVMVSRGLFCALCLAYAEIGRTRCPLGVCSNGYVSLPGGGSILQSPGPHMIMTLRTRSRMTLLAFNERRPSRGGRSAPSTTGAVYSVKPTDPSERVSAAGIVVCHKALCDPLPTPLTVIGPSSFAS